MESKKILEIRPSAANSQSWLPVGYSPSFPTLKLYQIPAKYLHLDHEEINFKGKCNESVIDLILHSQLMCKGEK